MSSRRKPNQERARASVEAILEGCLQVLLSEGPERLTTNRIAERAGVSVGTLYQYFRDKDDVLRMLLHRQVGRVFVRLTERLGQIESRSPWATIEELTEIIFELHDEEPTLHSVMLNRVLSAGHLGLVDDYEVLMEQTVAERLVTFGLATAAQAQDRAALLVRAVGGAMRDTVRRDPLRLQSPEFREELTRMIRGVVWGPRTPE